MRERVAKELTLSRVSDATLGTINHQTQTLLQERLHRIQYSIARTLAANVDVAVIETNLSVLANKMNLDFIEELIAAKVAEKVEFKFDVAEHLNRLKELEKEMLKSKGCLRRGSLFLC